MYYDFIPTNEFCGEAVSFRIFKQRVTQKNYFRWNILEKLSMELAVPQK